MVLWLKDADTDFNGTNRSDSSGLGNDASPVGALTEVTFAAPSATTENPASGAFSGNAVPAVLFESGSDEMLQALNVNGGSTFDKATLFAVVRTAGSDAANAESRFFGFGSKAAIETAASTENFQFSSDGSLRYDNGNNLGPAIPTDLHIRAARLNQGSVKAWVQDSSGLAVTISVTSSASMGSIPDPLRVDDLFLGHINGGATATTYITSSKNADISIVTVLAYKKALSDAQISEVCDWLIENVGGPATAPSDPSNLVATTASASQIDLAWDDNSSNETGFVVQRSLTSGAGFSTITTTGSSANTFSDTGLSASTTYYYQVYATNGVGDSSNSNEANATTSAPSPGEVNFTASTNSVSEGGGTLDIHLTRTGGSAGGVSVLVSSASGTATDGTDYTSVSETVNWTDGNTDTKTVTVSITDDGDVEGAETFGLSLSTATGGLSIGPTSAVTVTVVDDDNYGSLSLAASTASLGEGDGMVSINVTRTGGSAGAVFVDIATADGTATDGNDYTANSTTLNWSGGDTTAKSFVVNITDDADIDPSETFTISLNNAVGGASLGATTSATVTINDNEVNPMLLSEVFDYGGSDMSDSYGSWQDASSYVKYAAGTALSFSNASYDHSDNAGGSLSVTSTGSLRGGQLAFTAGSETGTFWLSALVKPNSAMGTMAMISLNDLGSYSYGNPGGDRFGIGYDGGVLKPMMVDVSGPTTSFGSDIGLVNGGTYLLVAKVTVGAAADAIDFWVLKSGDSFVATESGLGTPHLSNASADFGAALKNIWVGKDGLPAYFDILRLSQSAGDTGVSDVLGVAAPSTYLVSYDDNDSSSGTAPSDQTKTAGVDLTLATNSGSLAKTGYTFAGWNTAADGSGTTYAAGATYVADVAITLYARWEINTYTVSYDANGATGGSVLANQSKTYGVNLTLATNSGSLVKTGYTFAGWNSTDDGSGTLYAAGGTYSADTALTLYANWTINTYTLTYNTATGGGVSLSSETVNHGSDGTAVTATPNTGYSFVNWTGSVTSTDNPITLSSVSSDMTITANFSINSYTVTFVEGSNGSRSGGGALVQSINHGSDATAPVITPNAGYAFDGWDVSFTGVTSNLTVNAQYSALDYEVTYDGNDETSGSAPSDGNTYNIADTVTVLTNSGSLAKTGHTFNGWNTVAGGGGDAYDPGDTFSMSSANVTLYAQWTANDVQLSVSPSSLVVTEGASACFNVSLTAEPASGVTVNAAHFSGDADITVSANATLSFTTGNWNVAQGVVLSAAEDGDLALSAGNSLSFTSANWNDPQTLTVSASDDADTANGTTVFGLFNSSGPNGIASTTVSATEIDDDTASFQLSKTNVSMDEGDVDAFTVVLGTEPTSNVVLDAFLPPKASGVISTNPTTLTFTPTNWDDPQTINVTALEDDDLADESTSVSMRVRDADSDDAFDALAHQKVYYNISDDDSAGFSLSSGNLDVGENGGSDAFTVVLDAQPSSDVVFTVLSDDTSEATVSPMVLTFTDANWNHPQTVTVYGVDDSLVGSDGATITVSVDDASSDDDFDPLGDDTVTISLIDDDSPAFTIHLDSITLSEPSSSVSGNVSRNTSVGTVVVSLASDDTTEVTVADNVTIPAGNTYALITVNAADDDLVDGTVNASITASATGYSSDSESVSVLDDDTAGVSLSVTTLTVSENGSSDTVDLVLDAQPSADVTIVVGSVDTTELSPSTNLLTFTAANWSVAQTLTIVGVDDSTADGDVVTAMSFTSSSADVAFDALVIANLNVTTSDDAVSVTVTDDGRGSTLPVGSVDVDPDGSLSISAAGDVGQVFSTWTLVSGSGSFDDAASSSTTFTPTAASTIRADFRVESYSLNFVTDGTSGASITGTTTQSVDHGSDASSVSAVIPAGYSFDRWSQGGSTVTTSTTLTVTNVSADATYTAEHTANTVSIVLSTTSINVNEGSTETFGVSLSAQPTASVTVAVAFASGDGDLSVQSGSSLTFTTTNWATAQTVTLAAADDTDISGDSATFTVTATCLSDETLTATEVDDDTQNLMVSTSSLSIGEGSSASFTVVLAGEPSSDVSVAVTFSTGYSDISVLSGSSLTFTSTNWATPQTVTLSAAVDGDVSNGSASVVASSTGLGDVTVTATESDNDALPIITEGSSIAVSMDEDGSPVDFELTLNVTDANGGDSHTWSILTAPSHGVASVDGTGASVEVDFSPTADWNGSDDFVVAVEDQDGFSDSITVNVTVDPVNDAPVASAGNLDLDEDVAVALTLEGSDIDGDALTYAITETPSLGMLSGTPPNLIYSPSEDASGSDNFTFSVDDGTQSASATFSLVIAEINDAPSFDEDGPLVLNTDEGVVLTRWFYATDAEQTDLSWSMSEPFHGVVTLSGSGNGREFSYSPDPGHIGGDLVKLTVEDAEGEKDSLTLSITVNAVGNTPPTIDQGDSVEVTMSEEGDPTAFALALSATDFNADPLTWSLAAEASNGLATVSAGPVIDYTPNVNFFGSDSFTVQVADDNGGVDTIIVNLTVEGVNDAPTASSGNIWTAMDTSVDVTLQGSDVDGDALVYVITAQPTNGSLSGTAPLLIYTPAPGYSGTEQLTFKVSDGNLDSETVAFVFDVETVDHDPILVDTAPVVNMSEDNSPEAFSLTLEASDPDGDDLNYEVSSDPAFGSATVDGDGRVSYTPDEHWSGLDVFTVVVRDDRGASTNAVVTVNVEAVNDAPTATPAIGLSVDERTRLYLETAMMGYADVEGDAMVSVEVIALPHKGKLKNKKVRLAVGDSFSAEDLEAGKIFFRSGKGDHTANIELALNDGTDNSEPFILSVEVNDVVAPTLQSEADPTDIPLAVSTITFQLDEEPLVDDSAQSITTPNNYSLTGSAAQGVSVSHVTGSGNDSFTLHFSEPLKDGEINISVSGVQDLAGNEVVPFDMNRDVQGLQMIFEPELRAGAKQQLLVREGVEIVSAESSDSSILKTEADILEGVGEGTVTLTLQEAHGSTVQMVLTVAEAQNNTSAQSTPDYGDGEVYRLVTFPFDLYTFGELRALPEAELCEMGDTNWLVYTYEDGVYRLPADGDEIDPTSSWWLATVGARDLQLAHAGPPSTAVVTRTLQPGWNLVGNPYATTLSMDHVLLKQANGFAPLTSGTQSLVARTFWTLLESGDGYEKTTTLAAGQGAWVFNDSDEEQILLLDTETFLKPSAVLSKASLSDLDPPTPPTSKTTSTVSNASGGEVALPGGSGGGGGGGGCLLGR